MEQIIEITRKAIAAKESAIEELEDQKTRVLNEAMRNQRKINEESKQLDQLHSELASLYRKFPEK
jgi:hypothetical protein